MPAYSKKINCGPRLRVSLTGKDDLLVVRGRAAARPYQQKIKPCHYCRLTPER
jgi:hypothetical protein